MMKITRVEACWLQVPIPTAQQHVSDFGRAATFDAALVRIDTEGGLSGWGEAKVSAGSSGDYHGVCALINQEFAPLLLGRDARQITALRESMGRARRAAMSSELSMFVILVPFSGFTSERGESARRVTSFGETAA